MKTKFLHFCNRKKCIFFVCGKSPAYSQKHWLLNFFLKKEICGNSHKIRKITDTFWPRLAQKWEESSGPHPGLRKIIWVGADEAILVLLMQMFQAVPSVAHRRARDLNVPQQFNSRAVWLEATPPRHHYHYF